MAPYGLTETGLLPVTMGSKQSKVVRRKVIRGRELEASREKQRETKSNLKKK